MSERLQEIGSNNVLNKTVEDNSGILDFLCHAFSISPTISINNSASYFLYGEFFQSSIETLKSIHYCAERYRFADANMLIRKYKDDLFLMLYILEVTNNEKGLSEDELNEFLKDGASFESFLKALEATIDIVSTGRKKDDESRAVDAWFDNSAESGDYSKKLSFRNYWRFLKKNTLVTELITKFSLSDKIESIGRRQNNYAHNNGRFFLLNNISSHNNGEACQKNIELLTTDISFVTSTFLAILILIKPNKIASSDYWDYISCGKKPPEDSQYWIAAIAQDFLDNYVSQLHEGIVKYLRDNNPYGMKISC